MTEHIAVVIPAIPERAHLLTRALNSVYEQEYAGPISIHVSLDHEGVGAAINRQRAADEALTLNPTWLAFLDDDDEMYPEHLRFLQEHSAHADVISSWFDVAGGTDPFPQLRGKQWTPEEPHSIPITVLCRASTFVEAGGFVDRRVIDPNEEDSGRWVSGEDWRLWLAIGAVGGRFKCLKPVTWRWHHHGSNTSGLAENR